MSADVVFSLSKAKTKCTRVLGAFFDLVLSTLTFKYEYSKNGTRVLHHWCNVLVGRLRLIFIYFCIRLYCVCMLCFSFSFV